MEYEIKCPVCGGELKPGIEVPGYAICTGCQTWWRESALVTLQQRKAVKEKAA